MPKVRVQNATMCAFVASLVFFCATFAVAPLAAFAQVTIDWTPVGNTGNANDPATGNVFGGVPYSYNIDKYDVTNSQYAEFLNAKDPTGANTLGLFDSQMGTDATNGGITFNGTMYVVNATHANYPVSYVSWYDAIRFANWVNNGGLSSSDTESGAYTLLHDGGPTPTPIPSNGSSITRNAGATVFLPSENEWYKAAYYDPRTTAQGGPLADSHYWLYGTSSSSTPIESGPTALANHANYNNVVGNLTDVGAYTGTTSPYGAFDMAGNASQWNDALIGGSHRHFRGGSFDGVSGDFQSSTLSNGNPSLQADILGFRVANYPAPTLPGDVNLDGIVNGRDIADVASHWLNAGFATAGDANHDGVVNGQDITTIASHWLQTGGGGAGAAAAPEPSTLILAALGGLALLAWRRRP